MRSKSGKRSNDWKGKMVKGFFEGGLFYCRCIHPIIFESMDEGNHRNTIFAAGELGEGQCNPENYSEGEIL